ncbi:pyrimidine-nucleoside phosphorylase [Carboxydocella sp. JDF658]|uniref:pyrimidine-nucleoside phosphorylase n=1 Tax=Carboxydocella sp. JDF658 TaxID=1926600 RepID=UPI0009AC30A4|nr:pyrimidine-nucleoside phosphorylase [Carboxydocella sp. JDF658]GAW32667.1 pyrimidine-nucleoside phosphorylase [Carboxydocella sp. JDF658]
MRAYDIIRKKRDGGELSQAEIEFMVQGYTSNEIPDYQMAAWAMAVFLRGMNARETADLTMAMVRSGDQVDLSGIAGIKVDKHSTGGVGDTTTLVLAPLVAAAGAPVAKMSGRGLGHTGGTLDKFESIPGFRVELNKEEFIRNVNTVGAAVVGQTGNLAPADKKLYALRDVTATVDSIPLIASSIMSKKIAAGADAIVLDVKTGSGAFMKTLEDSFALARAMVAIGQEVGRKTVAVITDMDQPLGRAIGNALEVKEAIETLRGGGPSDLRELCLTLGAHMVTLAGKAANPAAARARLEELLQNGQALAKFKEMVAAQGGDPRVIDQPELLPQAQKVIPLLAEQDGYVARIEAEELGIAATMLGAGRETKESKVDLAVGLVVNKKVGEAVAAGEPLVWLHVNEERRLAEVMAKVKAAFTISCQQPAPATLIYGEVTES